MAWHRCWGRRAEILEKDIWLCQALGVLFALPHCKPMAFKGGTSLSKVYQAIEPGASMYGERAFIKPDA